MEISNGIILIIQFLLCVVGYLGKRTLDDQKELLNDIDIDQKTILKEVRMTNGRVTSLETAIKDHDVLDDTRFESLEKRLDRQAAKNRG